MTYLEREHEAKSLIAKYGKTWMLYDNEAIGEVMNTAYNARLKHDPTKSQLSTYLIKSVKNKILRLSKLRYKNSLGILPSTISYTTKDEHLKEFVEKCSLLSEREKFIIERYFFYSDTLQEIGEKLKISKQRTKQIYDTAISKLKEIKHVFAR